MSIFDAYTLDKIKNIQLLNEVDFYHKEYIRKSFEYFNPAITNYFKTDYLFHNVIFSDKENLPTIFYFEDKQRKQNIKIKKSVQQAEKIALKGDSSSLGAKIVSLKIPYVVLYHSNQNVPSFLEERSKLNLKKINSSSSYSGFVKYLELKSLSDIKAILLNYKRLGEDFDEYFIYFIRPITNSKSYNAALLLILKRPLLESEYLEISFVLLLIFSLLAEKHIDSLSRHEEWESIVNEQNHTAKHILNAIGVNLGTMLDHDVINNKKTLRGIISNTKQYVETINKSNDFLLNIMRYQNGKVDRSSNSLDIRGGDLKQSLYRIVDILESTLFSFGFSNNRDGTREKRIKEKCIPMLRESIYNMPRIGFVVIQTGFEIMLLELLKNAIFHADVLSPEVRIFYRHKSTKKNYCSLHVLNNNHVSEEFYMFVKNGINSDGIMKQYKSGFRTIKRILAFDGFNKTKEKWSLDISPDSMIENSYTDIYFLIPNSNKL